MRYSIDEYKKAAIIRSWRRVSCNTVLILMNVLIFFVVDLTGFSENIEHMLDFGAAYAPYIDAGEYYRLFTCMFLHFGIEHLVNNMLVLYVIGEPLEREIGRLRYVLVYLLGGIFGNVVSWLVQRGNPVPPVSAGASGAVFAAVGGMLYVLVANRGRIENLTLRQMGFMAALSLYYGFASEGVDNWAHIAGLIGGFMIAALVYRRKTPGKIRMWRKEEK